MTRIELSAKCHKHTTVSWNRTCLLGMIGVILIGFPMSESSVAYAVRMQPDPSGSTQGGQNLNLPGWFAKIDEHAPPTKDVLNGISTESWRALEQHVVGGGILLTSGDEKILKNLVSSVHTPPKGTSWHLRSASPCGAESFSIHFPRTIFRRILGPVKLISNQIEWKSIKSLRNYYLGSFWKNWK